MGRKLVIDVDTGVDDALALILALRQPDIEVLAVTCVSGNTDVESVCRNTLRILKVCRAIDVPVYKGADTPILGYGVDASHFHGEDGLGGVSHLVDLDTEKVQSEHAVLAMLRLVNQYQGEITLVALAPLTNVALALRLDPDFGKKLKQFTVMGGNIEGRGNSALAVEFNFSADPEAAAMVLKDLNCVINLMSWETNLQHGQPWEWVDKWLSTNTDIGQFVKEMMQKTIVFQRDVKKFSTFWACDFCTLATVINPDIITDTESVHVVVELHGHVTRGQMVVDWMRHLGREPNVNLITKIDILRVRNMFETILL